MTSNLLHAHLTAQLNGVAPDRIYGIYMDSHQHALATGQPASIEAKEGGAFSADRGYLTGSFIRRVPGRLIIQYWRSKHVRETDADAILSMVFRKNEYDQAEAERILTNVLRR